MDYNGCDGGHTPVKAIEGLEELKKIGWFERGLLDRIIAEVEIDE